MYLTDPLKVIVPNMVSQCQSYQKLKVGHEDMTNAYKFYLEVKGQHRFEIMNVRNTSSDGDTPMC